MTATTMITVTLSAEDLGYEVATPSSSGLGYGGDDEGVVSAADLGYEVDSGAPSSSSSAAAAAADLGDEEVATPSSSANIDCGGEKQDGAASNNEVAAPPVAPSLLASRSRILRRMGHNQRFGGSQYLNDNNNDDDSLCCTPPQLYRRATLDRSHKFFHQQAPPLIADHDHDQPSYHRSNSTCSDCRAPRRSSMTTIETSMSSSSSSLQSSRQNRRVSFGGSHVDQVSHVEKLCTTEEEKQEMWYNTDELNHFRHQIQKIIRREEELDETEDCWRGLESFIKKHNTKQLYAVAMTESEMCNQIILQLAQRAQQKQQQQSSSEHVPLSSYLEQETRNLESSVQLLLRRATKTGKQQAALDAAEARAIYMEEVHNYLESHQQDESSS